MRVLSKKKCCDEVETQKEKGCNSSRGTGATPTYVEATTEGPKPEPAEEVEPIEVKAKEKEPFVPKKLLPIDRGLTKWILWGFLTLGIYNIVVLTKMSCEINTIATRFDGRHTSNYLWIALLLNWITVGIAALVWYHCFSNRIGNELNRRQIPYSFGASDFWLWRVLGTLLVFLPFVYIYKLLHAMNLLNADYNKRG